MCDEREDEKKDENERHAAVNILISEEYLQKEKRKKGNPISMRHHDKTDFDTFFCD